MKYLPLVALLFAGTAYAVDLPHAHVISGGWLECDHGFLMRGNTCVSESEQQETKVIVSDLPSAGEGAPGTCPSGGCVAPVSAYYRPHVIESYTITGDQGGIGRSATGLETRSVTIIR